MKWWSLLAIYWWTCWYAKVYHVEPAFALAVAHTESGIGKQEFRVGLLANRWYGPFNVHKDYLRKWPETPIDTIKGNCQVGVRALRGSSARAVLKRYNTEFSEDYYQAVIQAAQRYRQRIGGKDG